MRLGVSSEVTVEAQFVWGLRPPRNLGAIGACGKSLVGHLVAALSNSYRKCLRRSLGYFFFCCCFPRSLRIYSRAARCLDLLSSLIMMARLLLNRMLPAAGRTTSSFVSRMGTLSSESVRPSFAKTAPPFLRRARRRLSRLSQVACHSVCLKESFVTQLPGLRTIRPYTVPIVSSLSSSVALSTWWFLGSARKFRTLASSSVWFVHSKKKVAWWRSRQISLRSRLTRLRPPPACCGVRSIREL